MRLVLHYEGELKSNGSPAHKHDIRKKLHVQLETLWKQPPLSMRPKLLEMHSTPDDYSVIRPLGAYKFAPLITAGMNTIAELSVTLMRPEAPGNLITQGGDIDNRLKTLFDALTMPRQMNALPTVAPASGEDPFFCLLEDDNLVTSLTVRTEQLLIPNMKQNDVIASIAVRTRVTRTTMGNSDFA